MHLGYIIIYVESVPDTLKFYNSAFNITTRFCLPSNEYGELEIPGSTLAFAEERFVQGNVGNFRYNRPGESAGVSISLVVENVDEVVQHAVAAGAVLVKEPTIKPWGQWVSYVKDCNGFLVEICTKVEK